MDLIKSTKFTKRSSERINQFWSATKTNSGTLINLELISLVFK